MDKALPTTYRVWAWREAGEPSGLCMEKRPLPQPGPGEVLIANRSIGLNPVDWKMIAWGNPDWKPGHVPGVDGVGHIVAASPDVHLPLGLRVAYHQSLARDGSFAEFTVVDSASIIPVPDSVDDIMAAAVPCPALTAWQALQKISLRYGARDVLVVGAGGAVGLVLSQLAVAQGWRVWATASSRHRDKLLSLGISGVFDYHLNDWSKQLQEALGARKLYAAFDTVSRDHAASLLPMIGYNGHLVCIQDRIDQNPQAPFSTAVSCHEVALNSIHAYGTEADWRDWRTAGTNLFEMITRGMLVVPDIEAFSFPSLPRALTQIKKNLNTGKAIVFF
ncbi:MULTISPECIES: zinc-binding dehydrogenase [Brucella]|uniref:Alcohol dehydrogenase zinc-containing n=1 Tax=Brucella lupini TaxID=255457 RepID=A0A256GI52_9HYPH|nr:MULTISPECIES: zinc-binding dehydrogenase [Brucella]KAB2702869.1 zinc-binding dehydrogenase [Brucella lupini]KAB2728008.1 zinc-binding dehydrogenase [Brucella anthropi]KAB2745180.1 zinc-binding dehydrogenase [Brucella anthropi]KAB2800014.1 zinc-binding dehydrogenase [Brucella anthropi]KAB2805605.1 zinc-binding dehydrogenase [Brucella anthropi]